MRKIIHPLKFDSDQFLGQKGGQVALNDLKTMEVCNHLDTVHSTVYDTTILEFFG